MNVVESHFEEGVRVFSKTNMILHTKCVEKGIFKKNNTLQIEYSRKAYLDLP